MRKEKKEKIELEVELEVEGKAFEMKKTSSSSVGGSEGRSSDGTVIKGAR